MPSSGFSASNTRASAKTSRLVGTPSFSPAPRATIARASSAACNAALPVITVTREL